MKDGKAWQESELDRLAHERIGPRDHRLACNHGRRGGQHHHGQNQYLGHQPIERILYGRRIG